VSRLSVTRRPNDPSSAGERPDVSPNDNTRPPPPPRR
jgi:hypothetical protein